MKILEVNQWGTKCTEYLRTGMGSAEIDRTKYPRGLYHMHGVQGYEYYQVTKPIMITCLKIDGKVWMVDDPLHWFGMNECVHRLPGGIMIFAGLGLGIFMWYLKARSDISKVVVVEKNEDVLNLIRPLMPALSCEVVYRNENFYDYDWRQDNPDQEPMSLLWDLAVGERPETLPQFIAGASAIDSVYPKGMRYEMFGLIHNPDKPPAVVQNGFWEGAFNGFRV